MFRTARQRRRAGATVKDRSCRKVVIVGFAVVATVSSSFFVVDVPLAYASATFGIDLGTLDGGNSYALAINSVGDVTGESQYGSGQHGFFWRAATGMQDLATLGGASSQVVAINNNGEVVGSSDTSTGTYHAFSWTASGGMVDLGSLDGPNGASWAEGVNSSGDVVGLSTTPSGDNHAFEWTPTSGMVDLGTIGNVTGGSFAYSVNSNGEVVGSESPAFGAGNAFVWTPTAGMTAMVSASQAVQFFDTEAFAVNDLGDAMGSQRGGSGSFFWSPATGAIDLGSLGGGSTNAAALSSTGEIVGQSQLPSGVMEPMAWSAGSGISALGSLGGTNGSDGGSAESVNGHGAVVGYSFDPSGSSSSQPFYWSASTGLLALSTGGGTFGIARSINDSGQIVGEVGGLPDGSQHAELWTVSRPDVLSFTPTNAPVGSAVTVSGSGFTGAAAVTVGGVAASFSVTADNALSLTVPTGALSGPVAVTADGTTGSSATGFIVDPTVGSITGLPAGPEPVNTSVNAALTFTAPSNTSATVSWNWGDSTTSAGTVSESGGSGSAGGSHTYTAAGVYPVVATVTDSDGGLSTTTYSGDVVVYDPAAGFVTGGGWFTSPTGALTAQPSVTGKATFGFVSQYQKGATVPSGNADFQFQAATFHLVSTSYQWLVVTGSCRSQLKGSATVNGTGSYTFLMTAVDGSACSNPGPDTFRIQITDNSTGATVYDNGTDQPISGGAIQVHS